MEVLKELTESINEKTGVSRRGFLKGLGALSATAAIYGCGGGENLASYKTEPSVTPKDNLVVDKEAKTVLHGHSVHCGGACVLKLHVKNNRVVKITSHGDISRAEASEAANKLISAANPFGIVPGVWAGSQAADESLAPIQRRCCLKGLSETKRIYNPDRLKYPLKQTGQRGDYRGFKRISWDEATDTVAKMLSEMQARKAALGYVPIYDVGGISRYLGPYISAYGNPSFGNLCDAWFGALGVSFGMFAVANSYQGQPSVQGNTAMDMLNSKFIINWSNDHRVTRNHLPFYMLKAKEAGIPVVTIDTRHTDSVSAMSTGSGDVPPWISVRPGMDAALQVAMANVIYRKGLHDEAFIKQYCFGFYPGDTVVSQSVLKNPVTGAAYAGQTFKVPAGQSFVEYLDELEAKNGGYNGVLQWASKLTGAPAAAIENLAIKYATSKPAYIYSSYNGGAQRTQNGMYYSWMLIALSAMTGNTNKRGGGPGEVKFDDGYRIQLGAAPAAKVPATSYGSMAVSAWHIGDVILTGRDHRTAEQLRADVLLLNKIDLGADPRIKVEMIYRGAGDSAPFQQYPSLTKKLMAYKTAKYIVAHEINMAPDAAIADIVLPAAHNFEQNFFTYRYSDDLFVSSGPVAPLYECKPDWMINQLIAQKMGLNMDRGNVSDLDIMKKQWEGAKIPDAYKAIDPGAKLPTFEEVMDKGNLQLTVPLDKTNVGLASYAPGKYLTDTGRINFYSPFYASRGRAALGVYRAQYVRAEEGYEDILENGGKVGAKGIKYTLQFITPHILQRAHSQYNNLAILTDKIPQVVWIHPVDAAVRGINNGDLVYAFNDNGCIKIPAEVTKRVRPGVVAIGEGSWYRASATETYEAWFDTNGDGKPEKYTVPVDVGGATNSITPGMSSGSGDPLVPSGFGFAAGGNLCEVSKTHPDKK